MKNDIYYHIWALVWVDCMNAGMSSEWANLVAETAAQSNLFGQFARAA